MATVLPGVRCVICGKSLSVTEAILVRGKPFCSNQCREAALKGPAPTQQQPQQ